MDVNGTRFHLVLGEQDWLPAPASGSAPSSTGVEWASGALRLRKRLPVFPAHAHDVVPGIDARRGAARDRYGHWYWISENAAEIRVSRLGRRPSTRFWSADDAARGCVDRQAGGMFSPVTPPAIAPLQLSGLALTADHYLVAGRTLPGGLLVFDLRGGGAPVMLDWPAAEPFEPFDISAAADGGVWILDRSARRLWRFDRFFRIVAAGASVPSAFSPAFVPLAGPDGSICPPPASITAELALPLDATESPDAVESLADGSVLVLDNPPLLSHSIVHRYRLDGTHFAVALDASLNPPVDPGDDPGPLPLPLRGHDIAFLSASPTPRPLSGVLYVASSGGNQSFAFDFASAEDAFGITLRREYLPMRRFTGKALVAADGGVYYDFDERWLAVAEFPNPRFARRGVLILPAAGELAFDGKALRCVWHRVLIDGCVPPETTLTLEARAADRVDALDDLPWQVQPLLYRRGDGPEIPYYRLPADGRTATWELLLQQVVGRYLQIRLTIDGSGRTSPRLTTMRVHYPRFSYLKEYLPAVYRDDAVSASFLDRFLANVEGTYTTLEGKIERVESFFDPRTVPAESLDWLAGWMGASLEFSWSERTRRLFIAHIPQMFRERGTAAGLVRAIRLALDPCPTDALFDTTACAACAGSAGFGVRVVERFHARTAAGVVFGDPTDLIGPGSTTDVSDWTPARGALPLHEQFRAFLSDRYAASIDDLNAAWGASLTGFDDPALRLAAIRPAGAEGDDWQRFVTAAIGFTYAVAQAGDENLYREFLARRYAQPSAVNQAYGLDAALSIGSWDDVAEKLWDGPLRVTLPDNAVWLRDWIEFVSTILPLERAAHRFSVLVPVGLDDSPERQLEVRSIAGRVAEIEKPAHAAFDVKLYWGLFRVGEARVGLDTLLGPGSRSAALVLDRGLVGGGHLGFVEPWNARDRFVVGREGDAGSGACNHGAGCCCKRG